MADTVKRALDLVSRYQDPVAGNKLDRFSWRPLPNVHEDLDRLPEIPSHVENFGAFMDEMAHRALNGQMSPRDLIKAYLITRSSIRRQAIRNKTLREKGGFHLPFDDSTKIRPEGAMAEWLMTPMGQRYLDMAERGKVDEEAVADAQSKMRPFGFHDSTEGQALPWAALNLPQRHKEFAALIADGLSKDPNLPAWRKSSMSLHGIKEAKSGFMGSLLGRGDQPTLDARQVVLQTGLSNDEGTKRMSNVGFAGVDRLAARQSAMNPKLSGDLEPFRQHLTHHAIWDKAGNDVTTHEDLMRAMHGARDGGRIGYERGGRRGAPAIVPEQSIEDHPLVKASLSAIHGGTDREMVRRALEASKTAGFTRTGAGLMERDPRLLEAKPKLTDLKPTAKSGHLITPFEELQADFVPKNNLMPSREADIERMQREGAYIRPLVGDKTPADTILTGYQGTPLVEPVNQQGGGDYPRSEFARTNQPTGWRSREGAAKGMQRRVGEGVPEGAPVYGAHVLMGDVAGDSSHMLLHAAINQVPNLPIQKKHIEAFDEEMRKKFPHDEKFPMPWPGILNAQGVHDFFYNQPSVVRGKKGQPDTIRYQPRPGKHVSDFVKNMDSVRWQSVGFPNIASARFANIVPELMAEKQGATGYGITQLDPGGELVANDEMRAHGTYTHGMPTRGYAGRFPALVPASEIWKEHVQNAKDPTQVQQTLMTKFPAAKVDQRVVDLVRTAQEERMKRYGFMDGGAVVNTNPTEAQKEAGNYKKHHVSFQGLPITIENPKGSIRKGKGWQVRVPYDYGYIKRTEGADGDHVDVCIGPDHASDHVFIIDQHDHQTGQFDEHKVMLGYRTREEACRAYCAGFSDGKGPDRMRAVARMSMSEFKRWLKHVDTTKPVRGQGHMDRALALTSQYTARKTNP